MPIIVGLVQVLLVTVDILLYFVLPNPLKKWFWLFQAAMCFVAVVGNLLERDGSKALCFSIWMSLFLFYWYRQTTRN